LEMNHSFLRSSVRSEQSKVRICAVRRINVLKAKAIESYNLTKLLSSTCMMLWYYK
jgi:hypothetical protein